MAGGKSVRLFLADGTPGGLVTAEIMNWTGHVTAAPRSDLAHLLSRAEVARTGVYMLLGDDPESPGGVLAYIGEGDDVKKRLYSHARPADQGAKDFWDRAIVLTSKDMNLTKPLSQAARTPGAERNPGAFTRRAGHGVHQGSDVRQS